MVNPRSRIDIDHLLKRRIISNSLKVMNSRAQNFAVLLVLEGVHILASGCPLVFAQDSEILLPGKAIYENAPSVKVSFV
ncbi:MAG: hypothetical protein QOH70_161 [Blastocatellia bacterium]|jgi:hypothetical protein|nr:hypothetical protein [Blastocatellia bacterium]